MFNEWLDANEGDSSLLIEPPSEYFSPLRTQASTLSLAIPSYTGNTTPQRNLYASLHPQRSRGFWRPNLYSSASSASHSSESLWSVETPALEPKAEHSSKQSSSRNTEVCIAALDGQCSCLKCQNDRELAEALQQSEQESMEYDRRRTLEDEDMARTMECELGRDNMSSSVPELRVSEVASFSESLGWFARDGQGMNNHKLTIMQIMLLQLAFKVHQMNQNHGRSSKMKSWHGNYHNLKYLMVRLSQFTRSKKIKGFHGIYLEQDCPSIIQSP